MVIEPTCRRFERASGFKTPITFSGNDLKGTNYKDITPRAALSYDLFGDGKTAVKVVVGKYMQALNGSTPLNPISACGDNGHSVVDRQQSRTSSRSVISRQSWIDQPGRRQ